MCTLRPNRPASPNHFGWPRWTIRSPANPKLSARPRRAELRSVSIIRSTVCASPPRPAPPPAVSIDPVEKPIRCLGNTGENSRSGSCSRADSHRRRPHSGGHTHRSGENTADNICPLSTQARDLGTDNSWANNTRADNTCADSTQADNICAGETRTGSSWAGSTWTNNTRAGNTRAGCCSAPGPNARHCYRFRTKAAASSGRFRWWVT